MQIVNAKPNPAGRDVAGHRPTPSQLNGEWVGLRNDQQKTVSLNRVVLTNEHFDAFCRKTAENQIYWRGTGIELQAGQSLRVHTGRRSDANSMSAEDWAGADLHAFCELGQFVLNNKCGDKIGLWLSVPGNPDTWTCLDSLSYDPNPPEGCILKRVAGKLLCV